jgi:1-acyl-sn-glycerol-3-phosphate acyltransferase
MIDKAKISCAPRPEDQLPVLILHGINTLFARIYHNLTIITPSHLPRDGPAIVVCNHISGLDPLLVQSACRYRLISWMMAREYMDLPVLGRVFRTLGVIPVDRGSRETGPLRQVFRQLEQGRIIGIFPEGKISNTGDLLAFQTGAAMIAIRAKVPVYPAYLDGTQRNKEMGPAFLQRSHSTVAFGPVVEFDRSNTKKETVEAATVAIQSAVAHLRQTVDAHRKVW